MGGIGEHAPIRLTLARRGRMDPRSLWFTQPRQRDITRSRGEHAEGSTLCAPSVSPREAAVKRLPDQANCKPDGCRSDIAADDPVALTTR